MAMTTNRIRWSIALVVSIGLLTILFRVADFNLPDLSTVRPQWLAITLLAHIIMVSSRGLLMRNLARSRAETKASCWIRLAARHQTVFSILPSGTGDLSFPVMARQFVALNAGDAVRVLILARQRDLIVLGTLALGGLALIEGMAMLGSIALAIGAIALWFSDNIIDLVSKVVGRHAGNGKVARWIYNMSFGPSRHLKARAVAWGLSLLLWTASIIAVMSVFEAVGQSLSLGEGLLFIAMINIVGVFAVSIAGFGVTETGAASALVIAGRAIESATATALIVRPALLVSLLTGSLLLDLFLGFRRWRQAGS